MEPKEPNIIILDVGKKLIEFRKRYAEASPYLHSKPVDICKGLTTCAVNRVAPHHELVKYVGKVKHSQGSGASSAPMTAFLMSVGDLGIAMIESMRRLGYREVALEEPESMPYHFRTAQNNAVVLERNGAP